MAEKIAAPLETAGTARASVRSVDGTQIGFIRIGTGPALVLVHGSIATGAVWLPFARLVADRFTCFVMDRRGRSLSTNEASPYAIEREYEDIAAVLTLAGPSASLFGHSFGAICTIGTALRMQPKRLVLYEPPLPVDGPVAAEHLEAYRHAISDGRLDDALEIGLTRFVGLPDRAVESMKTTQAWQQMSALTPTWTRELDAIDRLEPSVLPFATITSPTLLLVGSESADVPLKNATRALAAVLTTARVETLHGQGHMAMRSNPNLLAELVTTFLLAP
jgi:pimeloyl-ACP methyl ester carboxylesterase